ncbi:MAG: 4Fe-4S binding protein [Anaerolineae bacterium]
MNDTLAVWIDVESCTACGACIDVCPVGAITLEESSARLAQEACTGCGVCLDACPEDAIQPVVKGELVTAEERAVVAQGAERRLTTTGERARAVERTHPLAETIGPAVAGIAVGFLAQAADALAQAVVRWLTELSIDRSTGVERRSSGVRPESNGRGRRTRRRRRGG